LQPASKIRMKPGGAFDPYSAMSGGAGCWRSITILVVLMFVRVATASQQPADEQPQPTGSSRLTGRVIAADNGKPVRRAYISISRIPAAPVFSDHMSGWSVQTDANGQFEFLHLPAGSYYITVEPIGGFLRPRDPAYATLGERGTAQLTIRVARAGAIEGRVLDENGDAVLGAQVHALRRINIGGYIKVQGGPAGPATTDDRGRFRIFNVPPGEHYVVATYRPPHRDIDPKRQRGFANTYYPNALTLDGARSIVVRPGRDSRRADVTLVTRRLVKVLVRAVNSSGVPLNKEARLNLTRRDPVFLPTSVRSADPPKDGTAVFDDVTSGDYYLIVATNYRLDEAAFINLTVADEDVSLNVQTNTGARVSGRVIVDGRPAGEGAGSGRTNLSVSATRPSGQGGVSYANDPRSNIGASDRFELIGLRGPMVLNAGIGAGMLMSIRRGAQEIAGKTLEFVGTETIDDIVIEFTTKMAQLDVTLTGTSRTPDPEPVLLVLFSDDPSLSHQGHTRHARATIAPSSARQVKPTAESHTTFSRLVPGHYRLIAIHDPDVIYPTETAILERLRPLATPVTLVAGEPATISIAVTKLGR
jgi:hypothetical protein